MAERIDMMWDHVGEDLDTDGPLLQSQKEPTVYRNDEVRLSYLQTEHLVSTLEETSGILRSYLVDIDREKGLNLIIQTFIDIWAKKDDDVILVVSGLTMIFLQVVNLVLIVTKSESYKSNENIRDTFQLMFPDSTTAAIQIAKQLMERKVSGIMLAQTYFASILLFSGIYTVTKRIQPESWKFLKEDIAEDPGLIIVLYCKFLYFSVSTATLCGASDIGPSDWYNYIFVCVQMLLSFMFFASILGKAVSPKSQLKQEPEPEPKRPQRCSTVSITSSTHFNESYGSTDER